ncbi:MAG: fibronectin type III domain-containing protein, partial [Lachnospiraceae bacterium]|nr:fibronectin type III domain-containing protein [Lachnospiraceae bacterium]
ALKPAYDKKYVVDKRVAKPAKVTLKSVKNTKSKSISVSWKKVSGAKGYQITYSTSKKFSKKLTKTISVSSSTASKVIKSLKKNKTYYVKVRAFKKDKKGNKVYGSYSSVKKVAVKK